MIATEAFEAGTVDPDEEGDDWEDFSDSTAWTFLTEVEADYNCAGLCYTPLWYLTKNID